MRLKPLSFEGTGKHNNFFFCGDESDSEHSFLSGITSKNFAIAMSSERAYGPSELQKVKVFNYSPSSSKTVIFIHGGAWRSPVNTFDDFEKFSAYIKETAGSPGYNCFGINYRLSPSIQHPAHLNDVVSAINFISKEYPAATKSIDLVGHSVGATLILQSLTRGAKTSNEEGDEGQVLNSEIVVDSCYLLDGIYDIPELVKEYPDYISFVNEAFASSQDYSQATDIYNSLVKEVGYFHVIQSLEDELLSEEQSKLALSYLKQKHSNVSYHSGKWGLHDDVFVNEEIFKLVLGDIQGHFWS